MCCRGLGSQLLMLVQEEEMTVCNLQLCTWPSEVWKRAFQFLHDNGEKQFKIWQNILKEDITKSESRDSPLANSYDLHGKGVFSCLLYSHNYAYFPYQNTMGDLYHPFSTSLKSAISMKTCERWPTEQLILRSTRRYGFKINVVSVHIHVYDAPLHVQYTQYTIWWSFRKSVDGEIAQSRERSHCTRYQTHLLRMIGILSDRPHLTKTTSKCWALTCRNCTYMHIVGTHMK